MLPLLFVNVTLDWFLLETLPELKQLNNIFCSFFKHNQPIDAPSVKSKTIIATMHQFCQEFERHTNYFIIIVERIECPFN